VGRIWSGVRISASFQKNYAPDSVLRQKGGFDLEGCLEVLTGLENLGFFGILLGFLGFNVHNAEHRYMTHKK